MRNGSPKLAAPDEVHAQQSLAMDGTVEISDVRARVARAHEGLTTHRPELGDKQR